MQVVGGIDFELSRLKAEIEQLKTNRDDWKAMAEANAQYMKALASEIATRDTLIRLLVDHITTQSCGLPEVTSAQDDLLWFILNPSRSEAHEREADIARRMGSDE